MMEAVRTSETSVNINLTTRRYIPEGSNLLELCDGVGVKQLLHKDSQWDVNG
jgi:hypothetical protein